MTDKYSQLSQQPVMIAVSGLRKKYRLGKIGPGTLQGALKERRERRLNPDLHGTLRSDTGLDKDFYALDGIDLTVQRGETLGIIGKNGAGKSTLLKILSRITAPTEGVVDLYGRITSMLEVGTGFHGDMSGRENIYLNGAILGMTRAQINGRMDDIIRFAEMEKFIDTPIKRYSNGMFVKLGFSVAIHLESEIVIMDEVLAVGDVEFQQKCITKLREAVQNENRTVLYVSHNMNTVRQLCGRCIVLDRGRIIFEGDVDDAIAVYMGAGGIMPTEVVFGPEHRPHDAQIRFHKWLTIKSLRIRNVSVPIFYSGDHVQVELQCETRKELKRVGFRLELSYQDGSRIGSMLSGNFADLEYGESVVRMEISMAHLASGQYRADLVAFQFDDQGGEYMLDAVYPGLMFQIESKIDEVNYMDWHHKYWGVVRLEDMSISL